MVDRENPEATREMARWLSEVYDDLRRLARDRLEGRHGEPSLPATGIVHEAYIRLAQSRGASFSDRQHFFLAAARAMRSVVIDRARAKAALKRQGQQRPMPVDELIDQGSDPARDLALGELIGKLEAEDSRKAEVVLLRYYVGMSVEESAEILGVAPATIKRDWVFARAWLLEELSGDSEL